MDYLVNMMNSDSDGGPKTNAVGSDPTAPSTDLADQVATISELDKSSATLYENQVENRVSDAYSPLNALAATVIENQPIVAVCSTDPVPQTLATKQ